jgi:hypothetical protein
MRALVDDQAQLTTVQNELALIAAASSTLDSIRGTTQVMGQQLTGFTDIWTAVKSDCDQVVFWFNSVSNGLSVTIVGTLVARSIPAH